MKGRSCSDAPPPQAARGCPTSCVGRSTGGQHSNADEQAVEFGPREGVPTLRTACDDQGSHVPVTARHFCFVAVRAIGKLLLLRRLVKL